MRTSALHARRTYDDLLLLPDDGRRHELIDGRHLVSPSPNTRHQTVAGSLHGLIWGYLHRHRIGRVFMAPFDVVFSEFDVVVPDLVYVSAARQHDILTSAHVRGAPDLVVEIVSPSSRQRDTVVKRQLFEQNGVAEYWVVEPEANRMTVHRLREGRLVQVADLALEVGDVLESPLFPGFALSLSDVFAD